MTPDKAFLDFEVGIWKETAEAFDRHMRHTRYIYKPTSFSTKIANAGVQNRMWVTSSLFTINSRQNFQIFKSSAAVTLVANIAK